MCVCVKLYIDKLCIPQGESIAGVAVFHDPNSQAATRILLQLSLLSVTDYTKLVFCQLTESRWTL